MTINLHDQFAGHVRMWHDRVQYQYQNKISSAILSAVDDSANGVTAEIPIELPRQSGKTTSIVDITEFLLVAFHHYYGRPIRVGIFAPQTEQATTDFDRLKMQYGEISPLGFQTRLKSDQDSKFPEKWNSKTIRLFHGGTFVGEVYIFPISKTSNPESKTLDLIIVEEAQDVNDEKMKRAVFPMGASTNAPRVYVGTAGTRLCYFKQQLDTNPRAIRISLEEVFTDRKKTAEETGDPIHLRYEQFVKNEIETNGFDSDYIKTQYRCMWVIGTGQFVTGEQLEELVDDDRGLSNRSDRAVYIGIDTAKSPDQTVVTVIADGKRDPRKSALVNWLSLPGENYEDQFEIITGWLLPVWENMLDEKGEPIKTKEGTVQQRLVSGFPDIRAIALDATGQGDFMPDKFERHTGYNIIRMKFTQESKDVMYKNLLQVIHNKLTSIPNATKDRNYIGWKTELINLEKEYKGRFMSVHHPDDKNAHDDYPDSWALAEYAKSETMRTEPTITIL